MNYGSRKRKDHADDADDSRVELDDVGMATFCLLVVAALVLGIVALVKNVRQ